MSHSSNHIKARENEMRTDLIDLLAIERSLQTLKEDLQESVLLEAYLRATRKAKIKLLKKLKMSIPAIIQLPLMEDRFL